MIDNLEPAVEYHEGRRIRSCPILPELRPILDEAFEIFGDKSEYAIAAPQYRAVPDTTMGWKKANLRSEMTRLRRRARVSGWPRLLRSIVPLHACSPADGTATSVSAARGL